MQGYVLRPIFAMCSETESLNDDGRFKRERKEKERRKTWLSPFCLDCAELMPGFISASQLLFASFLLARR
jgi:hypothetical protein